MKSFSQREQEVVVLVLQGKSNQEIALLLGISVRTVEFHLGNIYAKAQVNSRVALILALGKEPNEDQAEKLGESTVAVGPETGQNGTQNEDWQKSLQTTIFLIRKELVMQRNNLLKGLGEAVKRYPRLLSVLLFLGLSLVTRYLLITLGLYFWLSYALLALLVSIGSMYGGLSWQQVLAGKVRLLSAVGMVLLPLLVAVVDWGLLHTLGRYLGETWVALAGISSRAVWRITPDGNHIHYLYRERFVGSEQLWLVATLSMCVLFVVGMYISERKRKVLTA